MKGRLDIAGVVKRYGTTVAVDGVTLVVPPGSMTALLGPSGCGKTTLLRCIAGLADLDAGSIAVDGADIGALPPWRRGLGMVFQSYALFPHMTVAENAAFGLRMRGTGRAEARERVARALALVRLEGFEERRPSELSGGQQQRAALARALVTEPPVLLLDEPLSALDAKLRHAMRLELRELQRRLGITTIVVTHDQDEAMAMADQVAVMNAGRIEQVASPETVYRRPATPFVAEFVGRTNRLEGRATAAGELDVGDVGGRVQLPMGHGLVQGALGLALLRPEHLRVEQAAGAAAPRLAGKVVDVVFAGDRVEIVVACGALKLLAVQPGGSAVPAPGEAVSLAWRAEDLMVWPR
ncbi:MAG: ABC transporter ATP-binding protein [Alphaproteobacteria bacterium]|nr:ABC transporter ATP-binding protein [Alphaproteobacteria bacterium]